jgi:hypothetical protein
MMTHKKLANPLQCGMQIAPSTYRKIDAESVEDAI